MNEFDREYVIQTRKEIQNIRDQMNKLLWFALFVLGGIGLATERDAGPGVPLADDVFVVLGPCALIVITTLFWVRRLWIQHLADRWFSILRVLERSDPPEVLATRLEMVVCRRFRHKKGRTYLRQEAILNFCLSLPIYVAMTASASYRHSPRALAAVAIIIIAHAIASVLLLYRFAVIHDRLQASQPAR